MTKWSSRRRNARSSNWKKHRTLPKKRKSCGRNFATTVLLICWCWCCYSAAGCRCCVRYWLFGRPLSSAKYARACTALSRAVFCFNSCESPIDLCLLLALPATCVLFIGCYQYIWTPEVTTAVVSKKHRNTKRVWTPEVYSRWPTTVVVSHIYQVYLRVHVIFFYLVIHFVY